MRTINLAAVWRAPTPVGQLGGGFDSVIVEAKTENEKDGMDCHKRRKKLVFAMFETFSVVKFIVLSSCACGRCG